MVSQMMICWSSVICYSYAKSIAHASPRVIGQLTIYIVRNFTIMISCCLSFQTLKQIDKCTGISSIFPLIIICHWWWRLIPSLDCSMISHFCSMFIEKLRLLFLLRGYWLISGLQIPHNWGRRRHHDFYVIQPANHRKKEEDSFSQLASKVLTKLSRNILFLVPQKGSFNFPLAFASFAQNTV